jgi:hypothetical protein
MTETASGPLVLYAGTYGKVVAVRLGDGSVPALDFLDNLAPRAREAFRALFARQCDQGALLSDTRFRWIRDGKKKPDVCEWKVNSPVAVRLYGIQEDGAWHATHGGPKPGDKKIKRETKRARDIFAERSEA